MKTDLLTVPGIGKNIKQDLIDIGISCLLPAEQLSSAHPAR